MSMEKGRNQQRVPEVDEFVQRIREAAREVEKALRKINKAMKRKVGEKQG